MKYSAVIFDSELDRIDPLYERLRADENCRQVVISTAQEDLEQLRTAMRAKAMYVTKFGEGYESLLHALKAVVEENVLVFDLSTPIEESDIPTMLEALEKQPAVSLHRGARGFDTRLLMFTLQKALEDQLPLTDYIDAIDHLADVPTYHIPVEDV